MTDYLYNELIEFYNSIDFKKAISNPCDLTREFSSIIHSVAKVKTTFIWLVSQEGIEASIEMMPENKVFKRKIIEEFSDDLVNLQSKEESVLVQLLNSWYYLVPIKRMATFYGFIGVYWDECESIELKEKLRHYAKVLAKWGAMIYERIQTEKLLAKTMSDKEQKRIAEEIHDLISGRLFNAVCATSTLARSVKDNDISEQLKLIAKTINQAHRELRSIIYSIKTPAMTPWFGRETNRFLEEAAKLHGISISSQINEERVKLRGYKARALHRIICEAVNNAIKHGCCKHVNIELLEKKAQIHVIITDDGNGFNPATSSKEHQGIGLGNIQSMVNSMQALFDLQSYPGLGTRIEVIIPNESAEILSEKSFGGEAS